MRYLIAFFLAITAVPAATLELSSGDLLYVEAESLFRFDPDTGIRELVSGCMLIPTNACTNPSELLGSGPIWGIISPMYPLAQPDGSIVLVGMDPESLTNECVLFRIDPATGDRTVIAREDDGNGHHFDCTSQNYTLVPRLPPFVTAFPAWGLPLLGGVLIGLAIRVRNSRR